MQELDRNINNIATAVQMIPSTAIDAKALADGRPAGICTAAGIAK